jgi:hypothetical protein
MRVSIRGKVLFVSAWMLAVPACWAQHNQKPAAPAISTDLAVTFATERSELAPGQCCFWFKGGGADAAFTLWKGLGIAASLTGDHASNATPGLDANKITFLAGPRYTWTSPVGNVNKPRLQLFGQGLFGGAHGFDGLYPTSTGVTPTASSFAVQAGGGLNVLLTKHFGLRLVEADYIRTAFPNGYDNTQTGVRLAFGATYHIGSAVAAPLPVTLACSATPASIFPGDPVTVTATAGNLDPRLTPIYNWSGSGVTGNGVMATVATAALAPGSYTVKCGVKEAKAGKQELKPWESAEASAIFSVKAFEPPTIGCSASPDKIKPGESSTITASGVSPQNRPLTYNYSAASGTISGTGTTATFSSAGAPTGSTAIVCNVSDDKGQTATTSTSVTILAPYVAPVPHTQALCSISFSKDTKRPTRIDNEAKACLDEVALNLQNQPDAKAVVVGEATVDELASKKRGKHAKAENIAAERTVNTKDYLVTEKGIDASRVSVRTGSIDGQAALNYLVPSGADFNSDVAGTKPVDEAAVKPQPRKPLPAKTVHKKTSAINAAQ